MRGGLIASLAADYRGGVGGNEMRLRTLAIGVAAALGLGTGGSALADGQVTFNVKFSGYTDCYDPAQLDNVPLTISGTGVLRTDRSARVDLRLTAYYILGWKYFAEAKLGDPPTTVGKDTKASIRVAGANGLSLLLDFPHTHYTTTVEVEGKTCTASLSAKPKTGAGIYDIAAGDTLFLCSRFEIDKASCRVQ